MLIKHMDSKYCPSCKQTKPATDYYKSKSHSHGLRSYCKLCEKERNTLREPEYKAQRKRYRQTEVYKDIKRRYYQNNKEAIKASNKKSSKYCTVKFGRYKYQAEQRGLSFTLTFEEFEQYYRKNCFYCNSEVETIGLDRVNNDVGYELGNVVSCCWMCNSMKHAFTQEVFLQQIKKIYTHQILEKQ